MTLVVKRCVAILLPAWATWIGVAAMGGEPGLAVWLFLAVLTVAVAAACIPPSKPRNLRLERADGSTQTLNCIYLGCKRGTHVFGIPLMVPRDARGFLADNMPSDTVIIAIRS